MKTEFKNYLESIHRTRDFALRRTLSERQLELLLKMHAEDMGPIESCELSPEEYARRSMGTIQTLLGEKSATLTKDVKYLFREKDLIVKAISPYNQRQIALALTPKGVQLCQEAEDYILQREVSQKS